MPEYFFELLTEEIPAWMLPHPQLESRLKELSGSITINYSPRRIAFVLRDLPLKREDQTQEERDAARRVVEDRKSTRLNSSHLVISYAVFCSKKKKNHKTQDLR